METFLWIYLVSTSVLGFLFALGLFVIFGTISETGCGTVIAYPIGVLLSIILYNGLWKHTPYGSLYIVSIIFGAIYFFYIVVTGRTRKLLLTLMDI